MPTLRLYLLGPPSVERQGLPVHFDRRQALALLAYLAVQRQPQSREWLAGQLWPEKDQSRARAGLRRILVTLHETLGPDCLVVDRETIGLESDWWVDLVAFEAALAACGRPGNPGQLGPEGLVRLGEAVALHRGDFLAGFSLPESPTLEAWQQIQARRLRHQLRRCLQRLIAGYTQERDYERAIAFAQRQLVLDPLDETALRQLMWLYRQCGRRAAALRLFEETAARLRQEMRLSPQSRTLALYEQFQAGTVPPFPEE